MILSNSNKYPNYAATIRKVDSITPIQGFDNLVYARIGVENVLVSKDVHMGDIVVFVPQESVLADKYLSLNNLYIDYPLNANAADVVKVMERTDLSDEDKKNQVKRMRGYFGSNGRVTLLKIRGMYSPGYIATIASMEKAYPELEGFDWEKNDGFTFDTINGELFCWKYLVKPKNEFHNKHRRSSGKYQNKKKKFDYLIPQNFPAHYNTSQLRDTIQYLEPKDVVDITVKIHGTSVIVGYVKCNKYLTLWEKVKKFFGFNVEDTEYRMLYSSRNVVLNRYKDADGKKPPYYQVYDFIRHHINDRNMIVYGEICGYVPGSNECIQKDHDYGAEPGDWKFMPYRIVDRNVEGAAVEYTVGDVIDWTTKVIECLPDDKKKYIMPLERVYHGPLEEIVPFEQEYGESYNDTLIRWRADLYSKLQNSYGLEELEPMCKNKVPREGIVIRKTHDLIARAFKLKSNAHYALAKASHDKGIADMEEDQEAEQA